MPGAGRSRGPPAASDDLQAQNAAEDLLDDLVAEDGAGEAAASGEAATSGAESMDGSSGDGYDGKMVKISRPALDSGATPTLKELIDLLDATDKHGVIMMRKAMRANMRYKIDRYKQIREAMEDAMEEEEQRLNKQQEYLKLKSGVATTDKRDNWSIYESISGKLREMSEAVEKMLSIERAAFDTYHKLGLDALVSYEAVTEFHSPLPDGFLGRVDQLKKTLQTLKCFVSHPYVVEAVAGVVLGFFRKPELVQTKFTNWMFTGKAGTGKTTIARTIASVFAAAGIFVYDDVLESGRGDFVSGFLGATTERTTSRLLLGLDRVHFVDEAYAIVGDGGGETAAYGTEAVATIVDFCTKYKGLHCLMFAGYERAMREQFLNVNEGLDRRIPYKYHLSDYSVDGLVQIFQRTLLLEQGIPVDGCGPTAVQDAKRFYTVGAWAFLTGFLKSLTQKSDDDTFKPLYQIIKAQAGAMTNLGEMAVIDIAARRDDLDIARARCQSAEDRIEPRAGSLEEMVDLLRRAVLRMALSEEQTFLDLYKEIADDVLTKMLDPFIGGIANKDYLPRAKWDVAEDPTKRAREERYAANAVDCDDEIRDDLANQPKPPTSRWEEEAKRLREELSAANATAAVQKKKKLLEAGPLHSIPLYWGKNITDDACSQVLSGLDHEGNPLVEKNEDGSDLDPGVAGRMFLMLIHIKIAEAMRIGKGLIWDAAYGPIKHDWVNRSLAFNFDKREKRYVVNRLARRRWTGNLIKLLRSVYTREAHMATAGGLLVPKDLQDSVGVRCADTLSHGTVVARLLCDDYDDAAAEQEGEEAKVKYYTAVETYRTALKEYQTRRDAREAQRQDAAAASKPRASAAAKQRKGPKLAKLSPGGAGNEAGPKLRRSGRSGAEAPGAQSAGTGNKRTAADRDADAGAAESPEDEPAPTPPLMTGFHPDYLLLTLHLADNVGVSPKENKDTFLDVHLRIEYDPAQRQRRYVVSTDSTLLKKCTYKTKGHPNPDKFPEPYHSKRADVLEHGEPMFERAPSSTTEAQAYLEDTDGGWQATTNRIHDLFLVAIDELVTDARVAYEWQVEQTKGDAKAKLRVGGDSDGYVEGAADNEGEEGAQGEEDDENDIDYAPNDPDETDEPDEADDGGLSA